MVCMYVTLGPGKQLFWLNLLLKQYCCGTWDQPKKTGKVLESAGARATRLGSQAAAGSVTNSRILYKNLVKNKSNKQTNKKVKKVKKKSQKGTKWG